MKLKKSDVNILLIVLGIGAALLTYFLVFTKLNDKTDTLKIQNASLQQEVDRLQDLANNKQKYLDDTATMQDEIENIKAQFAAAYQPEDEILYVDNLEKNFDTTANAINMPGTSPVEVVTTADTSAAQTADASATQTADASTETDATDAADATEETAATTDNTATAGTASEILLYQTPVTMDFIASYNAVKDIVKIMNEDQMRKSIDGLSLSFDAETGDLTGTLVFNMYSLTGTDATYTTPVVSNVVMGSSNIFNSAEKKTAIQNEKAAQKAADESEETATENDNTKKK